MTSLSIVMLLAIASWVLAHKDPLSPKKSDGELGRFVVSSMGSTAVMVDSTTGKACMDHSAGDFRVGVWVPTLRIDDERQAHAWLQEQADDKEQRKKEEGRSRGGLTSKIVLSATDEDTAIAVEVVR